MDTIFNYPIEDDIFSLKYIEFGVKQLANGKAKDIEGCQAKFFKMGGSILIPLIHKIFNLIVKQGFPKSWTHSFIVISLKVGIKAIPVITGPF